MKLGFALASLSIISVVSLAGAQGKMSSHMQAKHAAGMSKAEWQKMYDMAAKLFDKKDADALFSHMAPDFTIVMGKRTMKGDEARTSMKTWFGMMKELHCKMTVSTVSSKGDTTTIVDHFHNTGTMIDPKTHKPGKFVDTGTETATWVKVGGDWKMKRLVSSDEKMTLNGKPFNPGM